MRPVSPPEIAVVIPTTRRETRLAFALDALAEQTLPSGTFEVVVVRGEHPGGRTTPPEGLPVQVIDHQSAGPAELRNIGWRAATAPLIAFTDDDCRPAPDWLERMLAAARGRKDRFFIQGRTAPDPDEAHLIYGLARTQLIPAASGWYETCNMLYPRVLLDRLGGFDEGFKGGRGGPQGGEDTDLGLRALRDGAEFEFAETALVHHAVHQRHAWQAVRDAHRWQTIAYLLERYPEQRRELHHKIFWKPRHERFLLAAAGIATRRPAVAAAAALPYVRHHMRAYDSTPRGAARAMLDLPARVAADTAEVAVTLAAAARKRVLVL
jgi:GT2 family glycosyltransferase